MATLIPVDYDPFEKKQTTPGAKLVPVDYDPFAVKEKPEETPRPVAKPDSFRMPESSPVMSLLGLKNEDQEVEPDTFKRPDMSIGSDIIDAGKGVGNAGATYAKEEGPKLTTELAKSLSRGLNYFPQQVGKAVQWLPRFSDEMLPSGDAPRGLGFGSTVQDYARGLARKAGESIEGFGEGQQKKLDPIIGMSEEAKNAPWYSPLHMAATGPENLVGSVVPFAVGAAAGGGIPGVLAGGATLGALFYGGSAEEKYRRAVPIVGHKNAFKLANIEGGIEFIGEGIQDIIPLRVFGVASKPVKDQVIKSIASKLGIKEATKNIGKTIFGEVATEVGQATAQTYASNKMGVDAGSIKENSLDVIGPTVFMAVFFGGVGSAYNAKARKDIVNALSNPESNEKDFNAAVNTVAKTVSGIDKGLAKDFSDYAKLARENNQGVIIADDSFISKAAEEKLTPPEQMAIAQFRDAHGKALNDGNQEAVPVIMGQFLGNKNVRKDIKRNLFDTVYGEGKFQEQEELTRHRAEINKAVESGDMAAIDAAGNALFKNGNISQEAKDSFAQSWSEYQKKIGIPQQQPEAVETATEPIPETPGVASPAKQDNAQEAIPAKQNQSVFATGKIPEGVNVIGLADMARAEGVEVPTNKNWNMGSLFAHTRNELAKQGKISPDILPASGKPFKDEKTAALYLKSNGLDGLYVVAPAQGGGSIGKAKAPVAQATAPRIDDQGQVGMVDPEAQAFDSDALKQKQFAQVVGIRNQIKSVFDQAAGKPLTPAQKVTVAGLKAQLGKMPPVNIEELTAYERKSNQAKLDQKDINAPDVPAITRKTDNVSMALKFMLDDALATETRGTTAMSAMDAEAAGQEEVKSFGASSGEWYKELNRRALADRKPIYTRAEIQNLVEKHLNGEKLTDIQNNRLRLLQQVANDEILGKNKDFIDAQNMQELSGKGWLVLGGESKAAGDFKAGDKVHGELPLPNGKTTDTGTEFTVIGDNDQGQVIFRDGYNNDVVVDTFDSFPVTGWLKAPEKDSIEATGYERKPSHTGNTAKLHKKYGQRNVDMAKKISAKAMVDNALAETKDPERRKTLEEALTDRMLKGYDVVSHTMIKQGQDYFEKNGISYVLEFGDGENLKGMNDVYTHEGADKVARQLWGDIFAREVQRHGAIVGKRSNGGDEFVVLWPNFTMAEVQEIRADIDQQLAAKKKELGLDRVPHPRYAGMAVGAGAIDSGFATWTKAYPVKRGDLEREADVMSEVVKEKKIIDIAEREGYDTARDEKGKIYVTGRKTQKAGDTAEPVSERAPDVSSGTNEVRGNQEDDLGTDTTGEEAGKDRQVTPSEVTPTPAAVPSVQPEQSTQAATATPEKSPSAVKESLTVAPEASKAKEPAGKPAEKEYGLDDIQEQDNSTSQKSGKIEDFGEVLTGARKHYSDKLKDASKLDTASQPLSKTWPEPDYQNLLDGGVKPGIVAYVRSMRDTVPNKGKSGWKLSRYVDAVVSLRDMSQRLLSGDLDFNLFIDKLKESKDLYKRLSDAVDLYSAVGHGYSLKGIRISEGQYSVYNGVEHNPPKIIWTVEKEAKATAFSNWPRTLSSGKTREEAVENFKGKAEILLSGKKDSGKGIKFDLYAISGQKGKVFIGKKFGTNRYVELESFDSLKEAREYLAGNQKELEDKLEKSRNFPQERKDENSPRVGEDHLQGQNSTPEMFVDAFGFRGVQFGNYVEQSKRQDDLNEAYNALMDMSGVLGIPSKAISLNGELGLAFGARGIGGKLAPSAHYEPGTVVINLTKKRGAGSLAHEWWHAVDNYFERARGSTGYFTDMPIDRKRVDRDTGKLIKDTTRPEMISAFSRVMVAIRGTGLKKRSFVQDRSRPKPYWSTDVEMAARSFENYIIEKLHDQNGSNDYLANIVDQEVWDAAAALGLEQENSYPYLTKDEIPAVKAEFQNFFDVVETKETDAGVALFQQDQSDTSDLATEAWNREAEAVLVHGATKRPIILSNKEFNGVLDRMKPNRQKSGRVVRAFYDPKTDQVYINKDHAKKDTIFHEYTHPVVNQIRKIKPLLYRMGTGLVKGTAYHTKAIENGYGDKALDEALVQAIGEKGAAIQDVFKRNQFKAWLNKMFLQAKIMMKKVFGVDLTLDEFVSNVAYGMREGRYQGKAGKGKPQFMMAGAKAVGAARLDEAKAMKADGASRDQVWQATGWYEIIPGSGEWKFEIDDSKIKLIGDTGGSLSEIIKLPGFFKAYPELKNVFVRIHTGDKYKNWGAGGLFTAGVPGDAKFFGRAPEISIKAATLDDARTIMVHEVQHAIQEREGFARGGSPALFRGLNDVRDLLLRQRQEFEQGFGLNDWANDLITKDIDKYNDLINQGKQDATLEPMYREFAKTLSPEDGKYFVSRMLKYDQDIGSNVNMDPLSGYQRLTGEAEARLVQKRLDMTPDQRKAEPPWETLEAMLKDEGLLKEGQKPEDVLISRKDGGTAASVGEDSRYLALARDPVANREELQRMVDEAAKAAGFTVEAWHGTDNEGIKVFDKSRLGANTFGNANDIAYAATSKIGFWFNDGAIKKASNFPGNKFIRSYLRFGNIVEYSGLGDLAEELRPYVEKWEDSEWYDNEENPEFDTLIDEWKRETFYDDVDGIVLPDEEFGGLSYAVFSPSQIKSADAVVYYAEGDPAVISGEKKAGDVIDLKDRLRTDRGTWQDDDIRFQQELTPEEQARREAVRTLLDTLPSFPEATRPIIREARRLDRGNKLRAKMQEAKEAATFKLIDSNDPLKQIQGILNVQDEHLDAYTTERLRGKRESGQIKKFRREVLKPLVDRMAKAGIDFGMVDEYRHAKHAPEANKRLELINAKRTLTQYAGIEKDKALNKEIEKLKAEAKEARKAHKEYQLFNDELGEWEPQEIQEKYLALLNSHRPESDKGKEFIGKWNERRVKLSGITNIEARDILNKYAGNAEIEQIRKEFAKIDDKRLDILEDAGEITPYQADAMREAYKFYAPLYRVGMDKGIGTGRKIGPLGKPIKSRAGSTRDVEAISAHTIANYENAVSRALKAETGKTLYDLVKATQDEENAPWWIEKSPKRLDYDTEGNIREYADMAEPADGFFVKVNGERHLIRVDADNPTMKRFLDSVKASPEQNGIVKGLGTVNRYLSMVNTSLSPEFILSNLARDLQTASIHLEDTELKGMQKKVVKQVPAAIKGIWKAEQSGATDGMSKWYREFEENGGKIGWTSGYNEIKDITKRLDKELKEAKGEAPITSTAKKVLDIIENANTAIENGVRLSVYKTMVERGHSKKQAAMVASNLTVDFTKKGQWGGTINALYLFANAGIQGNVRMIQAIGTSPKVRGIVGGFVGAGMVMNIAGMLMGGDDDDGIPYYDKLRETDPGAFERNIIVMLPGGEGKHVKMPMPWGYNAFYNLGHEISNAAYKTMNGDRYSAVDGMGRVMSGFANSFNPLASATILQMIAPTLVDPLAIVAENAQWHGGPLMPEKNSFSNIPEPDSQRFFKSVSKPSKFIAQQVNKLTGGDAYGIKPGLIDVSPETLDMLYDTATGSVGRFVRDMALLPAAKEVKQVPFVRRFYGEKSEYSDSQIYHNMLKDIMTVKEQIEVDSKNLRDPMARYVPLATSTEKQLKKLRQAKRKAEEAGVNADLLEERINIIQKNFVGNVNKGMKKAQ